MNYIWSGMILFSLIFAFFNGTLDKTVAAAFSGASGAVDSAVALAGVFCFWSGILHIAEKSGFSKIVAKITHPLLRFVFPDLSPTSPAYSQICMNITANLMGCGNAATPAGISAMSELDVENHDIGYPSDEMCLFLILNTSSLQLLPTTVMSMRSAAGSVSPAEIIFPMWIVSAVSLVSSLAVMKFILKKRRKT